MNPKVEQWLKEQALKQNLKEKEARNKHLIKLGLIDETKKSKGYKDAFGNQLDEEAVRKARENNSTIYETEISGAIEVTDEEYAEICKYVPAETLDEDIKNEPSDHELLKKIERHTGILSTIALIYVILSAISALMIIINLK